MSQLDYSTPRGIVNPDSGYCCQATDYTCAPASGAMAMYLLGGTITEADMAKLMGTIPGVGTYDQSILAGLIAALALLGISKYSAEMVQPIGLAQEYLCNDELLLLHELVPNDPEVGGQHGHAVVMFMEPDTERVVLKDPWRLRSYPWLSHGTQYLSPDVLQSFNAYSGFRIKLKTPSPVTETKPL